MPFHKTGQEVAADAEQVKMDVAVYGTNGDPEVLGEVIFVVVRSKMAGAKMQHTITVEMKEALMKAIHSELGLWDKYERKYMALFPKNRASAGTHPGARTVVNVESALKKCLAGTIMKIPKGVNECVSACRQAQNELVESALIQSTKGRTRRRSWNKPAAKKARMVVDMSINHWGAKIINGTRNTKKENR